MAEATPPTEPSPPREPGPVEAQVRKDLESLPKEAGRAVAGMRGTLVIQAEHLARAIDVFSLDEGGNSARLAALAKTHQELRTVMRMLTSGSDLDNPVERFVNGLSTALRNPPQP